MTGARARWTGWVALAWLAGCSGEPKTAGDDDDDAVGTTESADSGVLDRFEPWEPATVGFELEAIVHDDGTLGSYFIDTDEIGPWMILTFTSLEYFDVDTEEEKAEQSCIAYGRFAPSPLLPPDQIPLAVPAELYLSFDGVVTLELHNCSGKVKPDVWGADAEILLDKFQGAHLGIGVGRMTDYLREAWSDQTLTDYGDFMLAEYVALNDKDGAFVGIDWTTAMEFEYDPDTQTLPTVLDEDGNEVLVGMNVASLPSGATLSEGYLRSFSYWYQDFPLLDLDNLRDGAPAY